MMSWNYGGIGLGLIICKNLVDLMDGYLEVESEQDKGVFFIIMLLFKVIDFVDEFCNEELLVSKNY